VPSLIPVPAAKVLLICHDVIGENMAGPAIRYWEMARALSKDFEVTLAAPGRPRLQTDVFKVRGYARSAASSLAPLVADADVILSFGFVLDLFPFLQSVEKPLIVDIYDPFTLEHLEVFGERPIADQARIASLYTAMLNQQLRAGDFFICTNERQRRFWLGMLTANNRVNPSTYAEDRTLSRLIDIVPFGLPSDPPQHRRQVLKGVRPGIRLSDKVVLWGGGIWEWLDPITLVQAVAKIAEVRDDVKLFFLGKQHFDTLTAPETRICERTIRLCRDLGLLDTKVFFNDWTPYNERESYLLEADIGVCLHPSHIETRFASRTRVLDYIWAQLPIVISQGDSMSEVVRHRDLGRVVPCSNADAVANAILDLLDDPWLRERLRSNFERTAQEYTWERVIEPVIRWCRTPKRAPDKDGCVRWGSLPAVAAVSPTPLWKLPSRAAYLLRSDGAGAMMREVRNYVRWRMADYLF